MELKGKTAIVTGSARGIGEGIALVLAREGANVVVNSRKAKDCEGVVQKIVSLGGKAIAVGADVSKKADVTAMAAETVKQFGAIDILVNNAGIEGHSVPDAGPFGGAVGPGVEREFERRVSLLSGGHSANDEAGQRAAS